MIERPDGPADDLWDAETIREAALEVLRFYEQHRGSRDVAALQEECADAVAAFSEWKIRRALPSPAALAGLRGEGWDR